MTRYGLTVAYAQVVLFFYVDMLEVMLCSEVSRLPRNENLKEASDCQLRVLTTENHVGEALLLRIWLYIQPSQALIPRVGPTSDKAMIDNLRYVVVFSCHAKNMKLEPCHEKEPNIEVSMQSAKCNFPCTLRNRN